MMRPIKNIYDLKDYILQARIRGEHDTIGRFTTLHDVLVIETEKHDAALQWLESKFNIISKDNNHFIQLESISLPIIFEDIETPIHSSKFPFRPLLEDIALISDTDSINNIEIEFPKIKTNSSPIIYAFFSYKGGVGRTMHITAAAQYFADKSESKFSSPKILLIDSDTEAPGLTWWSQERIPTPDYSYLDLLADAYSTKDIDEVASNAASQIQRSRIALGTEFQSAFILPAFRDELQMMRPPVSPCQITGNPQNPWSLGDLILSIGEKLKVDYIFIDLRAGMSELSSPLFFDPRVYRVIVTTTSKQSIQGTCCVLKQLSKIAKLMKHQVGDSSYENRTKTILNFIPPDDIGSERLTHIVDLLSTSWQNAFQAEDGIDSDSWLIYSYYDQNLLGLSSFTNALSAIQKSTSIQDSVEKVWSDFSLQKDIQVYMTESQKLSDISLLEEKARDLIYAELFSSASTPLPWKDRFLKIDAYRHLAASFSNKVPNACIIGAKGSGKTYFFMQLAAMGQWNTYLESLDFENNIDCKTRLIPLTWSFNLNTESRNAIKELYLNSIEKEFGHIPLNIPNQEINDIFGTPIEASDAEWKRKWYGFFLSILNVSYDKSDDLSTILSNRLKQQKENVTFLLDGLEDIFSQWLANRNTIPPLRILLQELLNEIYEKSYGKVGLLIFIRKDIIRKAITQNSSQFMAIHSPYELSWSKTEALRLIGWLLFAAKLEKYCRCQDKSFHHWNILSFENMGEALEPFWGKKLGARDSKEAYSVNWVLSAISDFKGNIQARDIIRLLFEAARLAKNIPLTNDRLLQPKALKEALTPCGAEKIREIKQEMKELESSINILQESRKSIPLKITDFRDMKIENISELEDFGFIFGNEDGEYYLPEIYRQGLGLDLSRGARPKVVSLMRKALSPAS